MKGVCLLVEMLLDELSSSYDRGSKKVKALRKESLNRSKGNAQQE